VAGAIVAAAASRMGHGPGVALAFSFGIAVALVGVVAGARLPRRLASGALDGPDGRAAH
jgi:hypothetical protein